MMSKEFLKHLGILGITVGLTASPLVMAQQTQQDPAGQQESGQAFDSEQGTEAPQSDPTMDPTAPADPAYPDDSAAPAYPDDSAAPADPADPAAPADPTMDPTAPADSAAPADPAFPDDSAAPADPTAPAEQGTQTDPTMDPTAPADPAAPGAEGEAGFGEGAEPMPGTDAEQDEWEEDDF